MCHLDFWGFRWWLDLSAILLRRCPPLSTVSWRFIRHCGNDNFKD
jgi:hypothetical protein